MHLLEMDGARVRARTLGTLEINIGERNKANKDFQNLCIKDVESHSSTENASSHSLTLLE
jgi:hypothetical protein